jgi:putative ubiquitin-RnfH superfamily antitoxin RatB of RatAB toxin-antitoxin module
MASADARPLLTVSVAYSPRAGEVDEIELQLEPGATVADALRASGLQARHPGLALDALPVGIWGAFCERDAVLRDRDRVELYRPLRVDPKEARRRRQRAQVRVGR